MVYNPDHRTEATMGRPGPTRRAVAIALTLILCWAAPVIARAQPRDAGGFVRALGDEVVAVLRDETRGEASRREALRAIFLASFDTRAIARFALGRYWRVATEAQKARYLDMFPTYVADIYAGRLSTYAGELFVVLRERRTDTTRTLVNGEIRRPDGSAMRIDFRVRRTADGFRTFDVLVEGLSLLITKRDEFAAVIGRKGIDGLLSLLEQRTRGLVRG
jgi:phospholipid transport system substrate-binding protein